ncbi:MAG: hypothetical protein LC105_05340 [Chitinophagales bacterium]|nr:hypothetical protein [Chitinophagales bacterium]
MKLAKKVMMISCLLLLYSCTANNKNSPHADNPGMTDRDSIIMDVRNQYFIFH